jgi:anti-sigma-K factor RskA
MSVTPDDSVTAAELALGLIEGEERSSALRRVLAEPAFAQEVERWRTHFSVLFADYPSVEPPAWIERRLAAVGGDPQPWRWATGVASLLAAGLAVALVIRPADVPAPVPRAQPMPAAVTYAAAMAPAKADDGKPFAALFDAGRGQVRVPAAVDVPAGRVAELWRIGADGVPHSLGLLTGAGTTALALSDTDRAALAAGATLAISIEPAGGSPTALPTGPVVAAGALTRI